MIIYQIFIYIYMYIYGCIHTSTGSVEFKRTCSGSQRGVKRLSATRRLAGWSVRFRSVSFSARFIIRTQRGQTQLLPAKGIKTKQSSSPPRSVHHTHYTPTLCLQGEYLFSLLPLPVSRNPLAKGLLSILSCVIYKKSSKYKHIYVYIYMKLLCFLLHQKTHVENETINPSYWRRQCQALKTRNIKSQLFHTEFPICCTQQFLSYSHCSPVTQANISPNTRANSCSCLILLFLFIRFDYLVLGRNKLAV